MRTLLTGMNRCLVSLAALMTGQSRTEASLTRIERQLKEIADGPPGGQVVMQLGPIEEQPTKPTKPRSYSP